MSKARTAGVHVSQELDFGPLFGTRRHDHARPQSTAVDPDERLRWARRALLASNLETFTAESVREFVVQMRPHFLESGRWIGMVFRSPLFTMVDHEHAKRDEAKARWIIRYTLTAEGREARRRFQFSKEASQ